MQVSVASSKIGAFFDMKERLTPEILSLMIKLLHIATTPRHPLVTGVTPAGHAASHSLTQG